MPNFSAACSDLSDISLLLNFCSWSRGGGRRWQITDQILSNPYALQSRKSGTDWFPKMPSVLWAWLHTSCDKFNPRVSCSSVCTAFKDVYPFPPPSCFFLSQAFAIPGQYAFAHQDVSIFFWVSDIHPVDLLLPTPSKLPLHPLFTLLCKDETPTFWHD